MVIDWFVKEALKHRHPHPLIHGTCERPISAGVPIYRFNAWVMTLHPDYFGVVHAWRDDDAELMTNISVPAHLDFTVLGPAVNQAARIEGVCGVLEQTVILSEEFAQASKAEFKSLNLHPLKGLAESRRIFTPRAAGGTAKRKTKSEART